MFEDTWLVPLKRKDQNPRIIGLESLHTLNLGNLNMLTWM
jgi:hypothetical protein